MKPKFTYQSYDYSFLKPKDSWWRSYMPHAVEVAAQTIGFDLAEVQPMAEPVGQLYWMDYPFETTVTTDDTTYEPIRDNGMTGGWEIRLTPPVTVTETPSTDAAGTYTPREEKQVEHIRSLYPHYTDIERVRKEKIVGTNVARGPGKPIYISSREQILKTYSNNKRKEATAAFFKKINYFKNLRNKMYGKKI